MISILLAGAWKYILGAFGGLILLFAARKSGADAVKLVQERAKNKHNEEIIKYMEKEKDFIHSLNNSPDNIERMRNIINGKPEE